MTASTSWTCPSCRQIRRSRFCSKCGEERLRPHDLTLRDLAAQFAKQASSIDGKMLRSVRSLLTAPGELSRAYVLGERRRFLGPLALFFVANALFVALQSITGTNVLSSPLASHLHNQDWSRLAQQLVDHRLASRHQSIAAYAPVFDRAAILNAKVLMIAMVLAVAPIVGVAFRSNNRPAGAHIVFSLHLYAFILVLLSFALVLAEGQVLLGGSGLRSPNVDLALSLFNIAACGIYTFMAIGTAYDATGPARIAKAIGLSLAIGVLFVGYRFGIFLITLYST